MEEPNTGGSFRLDDPPKIDDPRYKNISTSQEFFANSVRRDYYSALTSLIHESDNPQKPIDMSVESKERIEISVGALARAFGRGANVLEHLMLHHFSMENNYKEFITQEFKQ